MARTRQTARKSTGGKAPRKQIASKGKGGKGLGHGYAYHSSSTPTPTPALTSTPTTIIKGPYSKPTTSYSGIGTSSSFSNSFFPTLSIHTNTNPTKEEEDNTHDEDNLIPTFDCDATYENSFYSHYFFTGKEDTKVFAPRYAIAAINNPFTSEKEYWMSINFNSKYDGKGITKHNGRPTLNLVVALDISGSMSQAFAGTEETKNNSKMKVAKDSLLAILSQLKPEDSFGFLVFNQDATVIQPLTKWKETDTVKLEKDIMRLRTGGGTELTKALKTATEMYAKIGEGQNVSNRIFFLTDMEANYEKDGDEFADFSVKNSYDSLWTTVIGVGLDLNSNIIEKVSKTPGCNYSNVMSPELFREFMDKEFMYVVTPLAFHINIQLSSEVYRLEKGFGNPEVNNMKPGDIVTISTEFPSYENDNNEKKPGPLLFRIGKLNNESNLDEIRMIVKFDDLQGIERKDEQVIKIVDGYEGNSIRKQILLVRYVDLIKEYMQVRKLREETPAEASKKDFRKAFTEFIAHFESEKTAIGDASLQTELDILKEANQIETFYGPYEDLTSGKEEIKVSNANPSEVTMETEIENKRKHDEISSSESSETSALEALAKRQKEAETEDNANCVICLTEKKNVLFVPCKHIGCCKECSLKVNDCPLCRTAVVSKIDVFM